MTPTNPQPPESVEEAAKHYSNSMNGFLNEHQHEYELSKRDFIAGSNWKENQLREENERLREEIRLMKLANEHP